jgi:spore coat protein CotF
MCSKTKSNTYQKEKFIETKMEMSELTPEPDSTGGKNKKKMEMLTTELVYSHIKLIISCVMQGNSRRSSQKLNFTSTIYIKRIKH